VRIVFVVYSICCYWKLNHEIRVRHGLVLLLLEAECQIRYLGLRFDGSKIKLKAKMRIYHKEKESSDSRRRIEDEVES
jgi:hypothetical protein